VVKKQRSFLTGSHKSQIIAYWRERGVICYEVPLYTSEASPTLDFISLLQSCGLIWYWESARDGEVSEFSPVKHLPGERPLTQLTDENAETLLDDFREFDIEGYGRGITLFGCDQATILTQNQLHAALKQFVFFESGPIRIVLLRIGDTANKFIFVPHNPVPPVLTLLNAWGIAKEQVNSTFPYGKRGITLERVYRLSGSSD